MSSIEKIQGPIKEEIARFKGIFKGSVKSRVSLLNILTNLILRRKGKQMRPAFVLISAKLNGNVTEATYTAASLIELLHTAILIHDDVLNESNERNFFSINALWRSKIAVLMGDYLLSKGLHLSVNNKAFDLLEIVSETVKEMSEGELLQIQKSRTMNMTMEEYFEIIRKKNATLLVACFASGAISTGGNPETVQRMKLFGEYVGLSIQIRNDILEYQRKGLFGKPTGNDIKEKKLTLPLVYALDNSSNTEKKYILSTLNKRNKTSDMVKIVIDFVTLKGGLEYASVTMHDYKNKAIGLLDSYPNSDVKSSLIKFVNSTTEQR